MRKLRFAVTVLLLLAGFASAEDAAPKLEPGKAVTFVFPDMPPTMYEMMYHEGPSPR